MDLGYMDHLAARRLVNLPRVMMRHISYVISIKDHELRLTRENGIWWIGSGDNRRRDDDAPGGRSEERKKKEIRMTLVRKLSLMKRRLRGIGLEMIDFMMLEWR
ncbi:hypothetical protein Dimus_018762 [Dionaea muscipula]